MTDKEMLEKAIQKAIDNGWDNSPIDSMEWSDNDRAWRYDAIGGESWHYQTDLNTIIFSHDFAKALWPEPAKMYHGYIRVRTSKNKHSIYKYFTREDIMKENTVGYEIDDNGTFLWQYHLQQMVIDDDPIKYLEENI